jgi:hypothetical protein
MTHPDQYQDFFAVPVGADRTRAIKAFLAEMPAAARADILPPPAARRERRPRKPSIATLVKRAEETGKTVTSITTPDGTTIHFESKSENALDQWIAKHAGSPERH